LSSFSSSSHNNGDWLDLTDNTNGGVQRRILVEGSGESYPSGTSVVTGYTGTLASADWSVTEVLKCSLSEQQGLDQLVDGFRQEQVDEAKLTDLDVSAETFVQETLGVTAKTACKKLVLAAKRLATSRQEYPPGMEYDSNDNYEFTLGSGKLIRGMELAGVASMKPGETAEIQMRSDYAYGPEGYRKRNGDVMVPPFATLSFQVQLKLWNQG
jgi:hypothetical protein